MFVLKQERVLDICKALMRMDIDTLYVKLNKESTKYFY